MPEPAEQAWQIREIDCPYRRNVQRSEDRETGVCDLLRAITGVDAEACRVDRTACEVCIDAFPSPAARLNPVIPSLLFQVCDKEIKRVPSAERVAKLNRLRTWAAQSINPPLPERHSTYGCDVVICCSEGRSAINATRAVESVLCQRGVVTIVHLVDDGGHARELVAQFERHPQVIIHRAATPCGLFATVHALLPTMRTPYAAIQDPDTVSRPDRLRSIISLMEERRGELGGSGLEVGNAILDAEIPGNEYRRCIPPETLVFRRASLIDMGGFSRQEYDADAEIVFRANREGRPIMVPPLPMVSRTSPGSWPPPGLAPVYRDGPLRRFGAGFEMNRVACDVVVPFFEHPEFVHTAIESVLQQEHADAVIHLVDDASPHGEQIFARWRGHPSIRMYRNSVNIGPFASFNNVSEFCETDLLAVQDADDVSLPDRLHRAGNLLRLSGSDIFGGGMEVFENGVSETDSQPPEQKFRRSQYPHPGVRFFLENPTAMFSVAAFRQLGGYANFGERQRNRTGVDTELFARAYYSGLRFAITRDAVLRYRRHADSATQSPMTGGNSEAAREARAERDRRIDIFQSAGSFDPRLFGALRDFHGITRPLQ